MFHTRNHPGPYLVDGQPLLLNHHSRSGMPDDHRTPQAQLPKGHSATVVRSHFFFCFFCLLGKWNQSSTSGAAKDAPKAGWRRHGPVEAVSYAP